MSIVTLTMNPAVDLFASAPRVVSTHKLRCSNVRRDAGGGGINVARVVARLGGDVRAIYPAGGPMGDLLRRLVEAENVAGDPVAIAEDTRENFTIEEDETGAQYRFVLPGPSLSEAEWQRCLQLVDKPYGFFVASGSLPPGAPDDLLARAADLAASHGAKAVIDTSGPALKACLDAGVFLIKPSLRELEDLEGVKLPDRAAQVSACRALIDRGAAAFVALTLGEAGALLVARDRTLYAPAIPVKTLSAVGAGDSFLGAMVWSLAAGDDLADAFRYGVAAGAAALLSPGTELCAAADVLRLYPSVVTEPQARDGWLGD